MSRDAPGSKRERSVRYPGVSLAEAVAFCRSIDEKGLERLSTAALAEALGYKNLRTNSFSAPLSASKQFGLLESEGDGLVLTDLARRILHPARPEEIPSLLRKALREPPLYASLAVRFGDRRLPDAAVLANVLYHDEQITASAKLPAAEAFLESARFARALGEDGIFRPIATDAPAPTEEDAPDVPRQRASHRPRRSSAVRIDLRLWGADEGKVIRVRAPASITPESFERLLAAFRLHVRIEDRPPPAPRVGEESP